MTPYNEDVGGVERRRAERLRRETACPDPDHGHGCYTRACQEAEAKRRAERMVEDRLALAPAETFASIMADWPLESVDVVRGALLTETEPLSFTGMACFILDTLDASGYSVSKRSQ